MWRGGGRLPIARADVAWFLTWHREFKSWINAKFESVRRKFERLIERVSALEERRGADYGYIERLERRVRQLELRNPRWRGVPDAADENMDAPWV